MNRLLNYCLLFIMILIFAGLVVPFAILQVAINSVDGGVTSTLYQGIMNANVQLAPVRNALISGVIFPLLATICLGLQQYFYIKNLKTKMEYPVDKKLIRSYGAIGICGAGLIMLAIVFFVVAFCVGQDWDVKKYLYIGGMVVTGIYGAAIYIWAVVVNMRIIYDQAKQQAVIDAAQNDKTPPSVTETPAEPVVENKPEVIKPIISETIEFSTDFDDNGNSIDTVGTVEPNQDVLASSGTH